MLLLLTAIIRGALLVLAGIAEQKGWFTPSQFNPFLNELVNFIVTALFMSGPIIWHLLEAMDQKEKHLQAGFEQGQATMPQAAKEEVPNQKASGPLNPTLGTSGFVSPSPAPKNNLPQPPAPSALKSDASGNVSADPNQTGPTYK